MINFDTKLNETLTYQLIDYLSKIYQTLYSIVTKGGTILIPKLLIPFHQTPLFPFNIIVPQFSGFVELLLTPVRGTKNLNTSKNAADDDLIAILLPNLSTKGFSLLYVNGSKCTYNLDE